MSPKKPRKNFKPHSSANEKHKKFREGSPLTKKTKKKYDPYSNRRKNTTKLYTVH